MWRRSQNEAELTASNGSSAYMPDPNNPPVAPEVCRKCAKTCRYYGDLRYARLCQSADDVQDQANTEMAALRS